MYVSSKPMEIPNLATCLSKMEQRLGCNVLLLSKLSEYMKLAKIAVIVTLGNCKVEQFFFYEK
jgi:hypothetical protein